ncbi:hypothetical protein IWW36_000059 [Coemansia brasiliensis]|uniref:DUF747-domain-containing protein n=1 Tax=Coemansia brasiliensis TaxID=2650707 RepID=A0A9W8M252_9FUNG|nr:hypothetical protein IWW36_000059 [Coemansia brasiliensis]
MPEYAAPVTPTKGKSSRPSCIPLTSPTLLSPPRDTQHKPRSTRRKTLQTYGHTRQSSRIVGVHNTFPGRSVARVGRLDGGLPRLSLDSQRATFSHNGSPTAKRNYADGMHVGGANGGLAKSSKGHARGDSCPTLNITRIMRSISVSSSNSGRLRHDRSATLFRKSAPVETPPSGMALLSPLQSCDDACTAIVDNRNSLDSCHLSRLGSTLSLEYDHSKRYSTHSLPEGHSRSRTSLIGEQEHESDYEKSTLGPLHMVSSDAADVQLSARISASGLRRRISAKQREVGTPDVVISDSSAPLSPPISEGRRSFLGEAHGASTISTHIGGGDEQRTISDDSTHNRLNRRSAAIAKALQDLESASSNSNTDSDLADKGDGETMTITLKGPRKRTSEDAKNTPVPAVYLDGSASLWDHYVAELESSDFDPNIHLKRQRVSQLLRVPWNVEKLLWFGVAICFDALLHVFAIMPARFARAALKLAAGAVHGLPAAMEGMFSLHSAQTIAGILPAAWCRRVAVLGGRMRGNTAAQTEGGGASRWLSPAQLFDFYRGMLLAVTCAVLCRIDAAQMYHAIRAQSSLKLYFIFSALDIFDRLLATFGHDALDALQSTVTDALPQRWRSGAGYFAIAQGYMLVHTLVMFCQVITLNVAVNAYSDQLVSLLISVQFVEIKSTVFKKWEKEMLFQISCADIVERFQAIVFLFIIIVRNLAELAGSGLSPQFSAPTASSSTVTPTAQPPVSFAAATPSAFGPLVPTWLSGPMLNRILTPVLIVLGSELLIDWIKHSFVTKLNWIRPEIYSHYIDVLSRDLACSRSGASSRIVECAAVSPEPAPGTAADTEATGLDEKISSDDDGFHHINSRTSSDFTDSQSATLSHSSENASNKRGRSSSILTHAMIKLFIWLRYGRNATTPASNSSSSSSRYRHRRTQSSTRPQLFVDQSSRVARRLGLAPLPMACMIILMLRQVTHMISSSRTLSSESTGLFSLVNSWLKWAMAGWSLLDIFGWLAIGLITYALLVWAKLAFSGRLMQFSWVRYREYERRTSTEPAANLKQFDDATKKPDRDDFMEPGRLINREPTEAEWEQQRPKWTMDNIERYSLFKSRIT